MLRVWDICQLPASVEGRRRVSEPRDAEPGQARGPFREPQDSKSLGSEKCHLLKEAGRGEGGEGDGQIVGRKAGPCLAAA